MGKKGRIIVGVAATVLIAGGASALPIRNAVRDAQSCETMTAYLAESGEVQTVGDFDRGITVLGDSYTSGDALDDRDDRWVNNFSIATQTSVTFDAIGMTGFVNEGFCGDQAFSSRVPAVLATSPDVLVVQGGMNDWEADPDDVSEAASALLDDLAEVPTVIVVGPTNAPARPAVSEVDDALAAAAENKGVQYVSALDWPVEFRDDGVHMTAAGHKAYASMLAAAIGS